MSYIQIQIGGKLRGLKFNNAAVDEYWKKVNFKSFGAATAYAIFYAGLIGNDVAKGVQDSEYDYETVTEWVDELINADQALVEKVCNDFTELTGYKKRLETIQEKVRSLTEDGKVKKNKK